MNKYLPVILVIVASTLGCKLSQQPGQANPVSSNTCQNLSIDSVTTLIDPGGNVDWSPDGEWIAYDAPDSHNWTGTWLMKPDGSEKRCLTCGNSAAPTPLHLGNPTWHSGMDWIVVQGVESSFYESFPSNDDAYKQRIMDVGVGIGNELWAMSADGSRFVKLTDIFSESKFQGGVLHPHFSNDGKLLAWSQRVGSIPSDPGGEWAIKIADFVLENNSPRLENIRTYQPGSDSIRLYETHTFSPDGSMLLYTSNSDGQSKYGYDIYTLDLASGASNRLTRTPMEWDEHAHFSPDGNCIAWISSMNAGSTAKLLKTELWLMSADGSDQHQLSTFNDSSSPMYMDSPFGVVPADISWAPDGSQFVVYVIVNQGEQSEYSMPGKIVLVKLKTSN